MRFNRSKNSWGIDRCTALRYEVRYRSWPSPLRTPGTPWCVFSMNRKRRQRREEEQRRAWGGGEGRQGRGRVRIAGRSRGVAPVLSTIKSGLHATEGITIRTTVTAVGYETCKRGLKSRVGTFGQISNERFLVGQGHRHTAPA